MLSNFITRKYNVSFLDAAWKPLNINIKIDVIPRVNEFIYLNEVYYRVIGVVHQINKKQEIFIVIENFKKQ